MLRGLTFAFLAPYNLDHLQHVSTIRGPGQRQCFVDLPVDQQLDE